jgi:hypothetical protein
MGTDCRALRAALNALVSAAPEWLTEHADPEWFERYGRRIENQRLPKGKEARTQYLTMVGVDGIRLRRPGVAALGKAVAFEQRRGSKPLLRGH